MIERINNGNTLITLGEGTVFIGNISANENEKPFGIYISDKEGISENAVIIALPNNRAIASYLMALVCFLDAYVDENTDQQMIESIKEMKEMLKTMLPEKKIE